MCRTLFIFIWLFLSGCSSTTNPAIEGWVRLTFDIDTQGIPQNIVIVESQPKNVFDKEAIRALKKWSYKPKIVDGQPVVQKDMEVLLEFRLEDES